MTAPKAGGQVRWPVQHAQSYNSTVSRIFYNNGKLLALSLRLALESPIISESYLVFPD